MSILFAAMLVAVSGAFTLRNNLEVEKVLPNALPGK